MTEPVGEVSITRRILVVLMLSALGPMLTTVLAVAGSMAWDPPSPGDLLELSVAAVMLLVIGIYGMVFCLVPVSLVAFAVHRMGLKRLGSHIAVGAALGAGIPAAPVIWFSGPDWYGDGVLPILAAAAIAGAVCGAIYWRMIVRPSATPRFGPKF